MAKFTIVTQNQNMVVLIKNGGKVGVLMYKNPKILLGICPNCGKPWHCDDWHGENCDNCPFCFEDQEHFERCKVKNTNVTSKLNDDMLCQCSKADIIKGVIRLYEDYYALQTEYISLKMKCYTIISPRSKHKLIYED